jgi:hypothetical protein
MTTSVCSTSDAGDAALALLAHAESAAAALAELDHTTLPPSVVAELALRNEALRSLIECHLAGTAAALHRSGWLEATTGLRTVPRWLARERKVRRGPVHRSLTLGLAMSQLPHTHAAWRRGAITTEHVALLTLAASGRRSQVFSDHEQHLVEIATTLCYDDFALAVRHWMGLADPDGAAADSQAAIDARSWKCSQVGDEFIIDGRLDLVAGAEYAAELRRLEQLEYEHDVVTTRAMHGEGVSIADKLPRTAEQRRADAALAMARRSRVADHTPLHPASVIHVEVDAGTFEAAARHIATPDAPLTPSARGFCRLESGGHVPLADLVELLLVSRVEVVLRDVTTRRVDLGDAQRFFTGAAREAIIRRDGTCTFPGCGLPARRCDIDHLVAWEAGGRTDQANGHAVCRYHHRRRHRGWASAVRNERTGHIDWTWHGPPGDAGTPATTAPHTAPPPRRGEG